MSEPRIHPTAIVAEGAKLAADVEIGAYAVVGARVSIGAGTTVGAHAVLEGNTTLGEGNRSFSIFLDWGGATGSEVPG